MSKERLDLSFAYLISLSGERERAETVYNEAVSRLAYAVVDLYNDNGWYLQHIQELQELTAATLAEPTLEVVKERLVDAQQSLEEVEAAFHGSEGGSASREDVLAALGAVLGWMALRLKLTGEVVPFLEGLERVTNLAKVTPEQAFVWAALPRWRYIRYQHERDPSWEARDPQEVRLHLRLVVRHAITAWCDGTWQDPEDFGVLGRKPPAGNAAEED